MMSEGSPQPAPDDITVLAQKQSDLEHWRVGHRSFFPRHTRGRAACLDFSANGEVQVQKFHEADNLKNYFEVEKQQGTSLEPQRRLFLLEGINNGLRDIFAAELDVGPNVWGRHSWCRPWDTE